MDVILLKDVEKVGTEGSVVRVKPGYARNYLVPLGLATLATPESLRHAEETKRQRQAKSQRAIDEATTLKRKLEARQLKLTLALGQEEKTFGAITTHDIMDALTREHPGMVFDKHAVHLEQPIKSLGTFEVPVKIHPQVIATITVLVAKA